MKLIFMGPILHMHSATFDNPTFQKKQESNWANSGNMWIWNIYFMKPCAHNLMWILASRFNENQLIICAHWLES